MDRKNPLCGFFSNDFWLASIIMLDQYPMQVPWPCPQCTYVNPPGQPSCEMCDWRPELPDEQTSHVRRSEQIVIYLNS
jgi:hypothetical protein